MKHFHQSSVECPHCKWGINPNHFSQHLREKHNDYSEAPPVTYDTMCSVTLSLSDWNDIQTRLYFYGHNLVELGHDAAAKKVRDICSRLADQTDAALSAAADTAEGE